MNKCILIGNLGGTPELRSTQGGTPVANASLATTERWTDRETGERREATEWHRLVIWGRQAENAAKLLSKGRGLIVEGKIRTRTWLVNDEKRYMTEIHVDRWSFLPADGNGSKPAQEPEPEGPEGPEGPTDERDDIPF